MPQINDGITNAAPRYIDLVKGKLVNGKSVPYDTTAEVLAAIPLTRRAEGNSFLVRNGGNIEEWHFVGGTLDNNLVRKQDVTKTDLTTFNSYKTANDATVANKVDKTTKIAGKPLSTDITLSKTDISGIDQIDNTSDANKPVSTAQAAALALKTDKTYVDTNLANKANATDLTNYQSSNDAAVALKANSSDVNTALAAKADTTYVDTELGNKLNINTPTAIGTLTTDKFKLSALNTAPTSATDTGTLGEIRIAANYIYICIATNTWVRTALTTW